MYRLLDSKQTKMSRPVPDNDDDDDVEERKMFMISEDDVMLISMG